MQSPRFGKNVSRERLFALVTVLSQSFFTLVRGHLMSFFLLSVRHSCYTLIG